uniref:Glycosyltransferase n=1 Tax=viral metagenome TaxID=1070528 RepID=A0A6M3L4D9_9ZZZZ
MSLSVVTTSNNNDYDGCILHRNQVFIDTLAELADRHRLKAELVIVEWNPPLDKPGLAAALSWPKSKLKTRIITVPERLHKMIGNSDKIPFFQMWAKNVGIRRAKGDFVLCTNADLIFSNEIVAWLAASNFEHGAYYRATRHDTNEKVIPDGLVDYRLDFCHRHVTRINESKLGQLHSNACGDFMLMAQEHWYACRGYPELPLWSIFVDGLLLYAAHAIGLEEKRLEYPIYHIAHDLAWTNSQELGELYPRLGYQTEYAPWRDKMITERRVINPNTEYWGFALEALDEIAI